MATSTLTIPAVTGPGPSALIPAPAPVIQVNLPKEEPLMIQLLKPLEEPSQKEQEEENFTYIENAPRSKKDIDSLRRNLATMGPQMNNLANNLSTRHINPVPQQVTAELITPADLTHLMRDPQGPNSLYTQVRNKLINDSLNPDVIMGPASNDPAIRRDQLAEAIQQYYIQDKLPEIQYVLTGDKHLEHKLRPEDIHHIQFRTYYEEMTPDKVVDNFEKDIIKMGYKIGKKDKDELDRIKKVVEETKRNYQNWLVDPRKDKATKQLEEEKVEQKFIQDISNAWQDLDALAGTMDINKRAHGAIIGSSEKFKSEMRSKGLVDLNMINNYIGRIEAMNKDTSGKIIDKQLDDKLKVLVRKIKGIEDPTGINIEEVYDELNAMRPITTPYKEIISEPEERKIEIKTEDWAKQLRELGLISVPGIYLEPTKFTDLDTAPIKGLNAQIEESKTLEELRRDIEKNIEYRRLQTTVTDKGKMKGTSLKTLWDTFRKTKNELKGLGVEFDDDLINTIHSGSNKENLRRGVERMKTLIKELRENLNQAALLQTSKAVNKKDIVKYIPNELLQKPTQTKMIKRKLKIGLPVELTPDENPIIPPVDIQDTLKERLDILKFGNTFSKHERKGLKAMYGSKIIEYNVTDEEELNNMKKEVMALEGQLFIIDPKSGRLFPINSINAFKGATYIFMKGKQERIPIGGAFAKRSVLNSILEDQEHLFPYKFMRYGNDKAPYRFHQLQRHNKNPHPKYKTKIVGGKFLFHVAKQISKGMNNFGKSVYNVSDSISHSAVQKTKNAALELGKDTIMEGKNFLNKEKKNINLIKSSTSNFIQKPNLKSGLNMITGINQGITNMVAQPVISAAREGAQISDFFHQVPGLNVATTALEYAIPALGVADSAMNAVRSIDDGKYLQGTLQGLDSVLGSDILSGQAKDLANVASNALLATQISQGAVNQIKNI